MIFFAEAKRLFLNRRMLAAVLLLLLVSLLWTKTQVDNTFRYQVGEAEYLHYCEKWQGDFTESKQEEIEREAAFIESTLAKRQENEKLYEQGKMSREDYTAYLGDFNYAEAYGTGFERFYQQYQRVLAHSENGEATRPKFLYDSYWNELFKNYPTVLLLLLFVFAIVPFVVSDYASDMWRIVKPTRKGLRKLLLIRLSVVLLFCVLVQSLLSAAQYALMDGAYRLDLSSYPVQSLDIFQNLQQAGSLAQYYILLSLYRMLFSIGLCIIIFSASLLLKNLMLSIGVTVGTALLPMASKTFAYAVYLYSPISGLYVNDLIAYQAGPVKFIVMLGGYVAAAMLLFISALKIRG